MPVAACETGKRSGVDAGEGDPSRDAGADAGGKGPSHSVGVDAGGENLSHNVVSLLSQLVDDNLRLVRSISAGLALAGVLVTARSIRLLTKFGAVSEIPARFIESNVSLRGKIHSITEKGLEVEHVPIHIPIVSPLFSKRVRASPLPVRLAGVELTAEGTTWLQERLEPAQGVWMKLISREEDALHCLVSYRKRGAMLSRCVNDEVLRLGLARTMPVSGLSHDSRLHWRLHKRLLRAEVRAERKGRGLWREDGWWNRASDALFRAVKGLFRKTGSSQ